MAVGLKIKRALKKLIREVIALLLEHQSSVIEHEIVTLSVDLIGTARQEGAAD